MEKLTKNELREVKLLISYYGSLDLDCDRDNGAPPHAERDTLNGLRKLMDNYESK